MSSFIKEGRRRRQPPAATVAFVAPAPITPAPAPVSVVAPVVAPVVSKERFAIKHYDRPTQSDMAVIIPFFNPASSTRILQNLLMVKHAHDCAGIPTFFAELAFGDAPFFLKDDPHTFQYRSNSYMFYKENLIKVAEARIPETYTKIVILDADILFQDCVWYDKLSRELDSAPVVQPFKTAIYLGLDFTQIEPKLSIAASNAKGHPGFAWAFQRTYFKSFGFFDYSVMGGGDRVLCYKLGFTKDIDSIYKPELPHNAVMSLEKHYFNTTIYHLPHGLRKDRQYSTRIQSFADTMIILGVKKISDLVERRGDGILEWKPVYKTLLNNLVKTYFENRKDDGIL